MESVKLLLRYGGDDAVNVALPIRELFYCVKSDSTGVKAMYVLSKRFDLLLRKEAS